MDLGYDNTDFTGIDEFCRNLDVPLTLISTQIGKIVMEERKESNPCSLCAKLRKGALVDEAVRLGCTRIAYAHHKDDFVETMLMSMIFQGKFYAFPPVTLFEDKNLRVIRPLMLVEESQVKGFVKRQEFPVLKSPCPIEGTTKRAYAKDLVAQLQKEHPGTKERLFHAITEGKIETGIRREFNCFPIPTESLSGAGRFLYLVSGGIVAVLYHPVYEKAVKEPVGKREKIIGLNVQMRNHIHIFQFLAEISQIPFGLLHMLAGLVHFGVLCQTGDKSSGEHIKKPPVVGTVQIFLCGTKAFQACCRPSMASLFSFSKLYAIFFPC